MCDERVNDKMEDTKPDVAASAVERLVMPIGVTWATCGVCGVNGPTDEDKCPCCGWEFSSTIISLGHERVSEMCHNVFKYSHAVFLEQIKAMKKKA